MKTYKILSIDAWRYDGGWDWNNWHKVHDAFPAELAGNTRKTLNWFRRHGLLGEGSKGRVAIEDDEYNYVICDRYNNRPLFAIEYGSEY